MIQNFEVGDRVRMTNEALENCGQEYKDTVFVVESVATKYMPADKFFSRKMPAGYHPGYDSCANEALYDLVGFGNSLYDYELAEVTS